MELNREHFRAIIFYNFRRQLSQQECCAELISVFRNEAPHQSTVSRWYAEFKRGRVSLSDDPRSGAPKTVVTQENIDAVRMLITEDRHVTYREIEASLAISKTSIQKILHEELRVRKLVSRWIPHLLTEEQKEARVMWCQTTLDRFEAGNSKNVYSIVSGDESWIYSYEPENKRQSSVWVFQDEEKPTKVIRSRSVSKKMVATFVSKAGHVATIPLENQQTVTADWYIAICLPKVIAELRKANPQRRIILHQDNASSHTARKTIEFLTYQNVELLDHPPYSPDLSPNDFYTFPKIKNELRGQRFQTPEEAVNAFKNAILTVPTNEWNNSFDNWFERMQKCIKFRGEYFEKQ
ncbi:histone-lysine N-methyltransferase SETMAR-like [Anthonomus grandis grandis]|uniref:histone-lysine N-methyltransferase SETMAR-like n=1 Tax=Anthonomus grandis grandis TaxID=2921223 RepID=UPI0021662F5A|nr:histone-lysine N-methyltransferase SETMAR-like [Anthonomus grandis grandis]